MDEPYPTISVVIPAYNEERYIAGAIKAVLAQSEAPLEIIVVDDGSTDRTLQRAARFGDAIRTVRQANGGCPAAFNRGFAEARGDYVALCPADDEWHPRKLERQRAALALDPAIDVHFTSARFFGLEEWDFPAPPAAGRLDSAAFAGAMYEHNRIPDPSAVIRRALHARLGGYLPLVGEDYEFWMRALGAGAVFYFDPEPLVRLRVHGGNLSRQALAIWETNHLVHHRYAGAAGEPALARRVLLRDLLAIGRCRLGLSLVPEARDAYRASVRQGPSPTGLAALALLSLPGAGAVVRRFNAWRARARGPASEVPA